MPDNEFSTLLEALVPPRYVPMYLNSATFHDSIQRLAHSLPLVIEALAAQAMATETEQQRQLLNLFEVETASQVRAVSTLLPR